MLKRGTIKAFMNFVFLSIIIIAISAFFISQEELIGAAFLFLGVISLVFLKFLKIDITSIYPDLVFGFIDNFILVFAAVLGSNYAGVLGAIIGGAAGNTITDGLGGFFEGQMSEKLRKRQITHERNMLSTMLGKMSGCLFGAGIGLILIWIFKIFFN